MPFDRDPMILAPAVFMLAARTGWQAMLPETEKLGEMGLRVLLTLVVAFIAQRILFLLVGRIEKAVRRAGRESEPSRQRASTVGQVLRNFITTLVAAAVLIHVLAILGWDIKPILAGAGILGVALGFGAQTLVRDVIAGFFILAEDQFSVGDLIEIGAKPATVEAITLRMTRLRDFNGYVHFVANGEMKTVTNRSRGWQRLALDVPIAANADVETALAATRGVVAAINSEPAWRERLLDPAEVWGVENLDPNESYIRVVLRARPGPDAPEVSREMRRRLHVALAGAGHHFRSTREMVIAPRRDEPRP